MTLNEVEFPLKHIDPLSVEPPNELQKSESDFQMLVNLEGDSVSFGVSVREGANGELFMVMSLHVSQTF